MDGDTFAQGSSSLPLSLKRISIRLCYDWCLPDCIINTSFPPFLQDLLIRSDSCKHYIDAIQWKILPDSLTSLTLENLNVKSLPLIWPSKLQLLSFHLCCKTYHYQDVFDATKEVVLNLKTSTPDELSKWKFSENIILSMLATPPRCVMHSSQPRFDNFLIVDRVARTFTVEVQ
jgi:hypothetical protein